MYCDSGDVQNLVLNSRLLSGPVPKSCLPGITLILCFKVILTVVLSGYVIRLFS